VRADVFSNVSEGGVGLHVAGVRGRCVVQHNMPCKCLHKVNSNGCQPGLIAAGVKAMLRELPHNMYGRLDEIDPVNARNCSDEVWSSSSSSSSSMQPCALAVQ
jgi:hypothetical protein